MSFNFKLEHKKLFMSKTITGKTFKLTKLNSKSEDDANFIINLRNRKLNNFLKISSNSLQDQMKYLTNYQFKFDRGEEIYYKIFDISKNTYNGVVRFTELNGTDKFGYESMVVKEEISPLVPTDVVLAIYSIGFEKLGKESCGPFPVTKENIRVLKWHEKIGMTEIVNKDENYFYLEVSSKNFFRAIGKFNKIGLGFVNYSN
jgi:hypothetical protein